MGYLHYIGKHSSQLRAGYHQPYTSRLNHWRHNHSWRTWGSPLDRFKKWTHSLIRHSRENPLSWANYKRIARQTLHDSFNHQSCTQFLSLVDLDRTTFWGFATHRNTSRVRAWYSLPAASHATFCTLRTQHTVYRSHMFQANTKSTGTWHYHHAHDWHKRHPMDCLLSSSIIEKNEHASCSKRSPVD